MDDPAPMRVLEQTARRSVTLDPLDRRAVGQMISGMLGAEAVKATMLDGEDEAKAFARYEQRIKRAFLLSFWGGALFRKVVKTPALDWLVAASEQPIVASVSAKLMALM